MIQDGVFGPERKKSQGRPRWRLVDESLGQELDISSMFCIPVKSRTMKKTADADKEEWDILDGDVKACELKSCDVPVGDVEVASRPICKQPLKARSAIKPLAGKIAMKPKTSVKKKGYVSPASTRSLMASPSQSTRSLTSPKRLSGVYSPPPPSKRSLLTSSSRSSRVSATPSPPPKRKLSVDGLLTDSNPARKARRISSAGARRAVLQN